MATHANLQPYLSPAEASNFQPGAGHGSQPFTASANNSNPRLVVEGHDQTQTTTIEGGYDPAQLAANVHQLVEQNRQLLAHIGHVPADAQYHKQEELKRKYLRQWKEEILPHKINDRNSPLWELRSSFRWPRRIPAPPTGSGSQANQSSVIDDAEEEEDRKLEDMFQPDQLWNSWQYRMAYPCLSRFLASADASKKTRSEVSYMDFDPEDTEHLTKEWISTEKYEVTSLNGSINVPADPATKVLRQNILDHGELWGHIKTRIDERPDRNSSGLGTGNLQRDYKVPCRILRITDLSAVVAGLVLGSTPRIDLAYIAPFLERYLKFSNWATANMIMTGGENVKRINTYLFEYHFAFYYVPTISMDPELASKDFRGIRNVASFDRGISSRHRYIYEEQLSFILVGHGGDVYTNYQLSEKYFVGPYLKNAEGISVFVTNKGWKPHTMFLTWISMALHHVAARWQTAIDAIDSQIDSPHDVIFHEDEDRSDLLSDDPNFSRSKTYFWAIQVFRLFEAKLAKTIATWDDFKKDSLLKINDGNVEKEHWEEQVQLIDKAIRSLHDKLQRVQKKREEVVSLRDGLFGASSLFDSRTAVRQGDNIRLLTYINLLFLPLTFCTSLFGMQTILPPTLPMRDFIITLPVITIFTTFLVFNLEDIVDFSQHTTQQITTWMTNHMRQHRRKTWKRRAQALHEDRIATELPVKKRRRKSTRWMYLFYILEAVLVTVPVDEVRSALGLWGLRSRFSTKPDVLEQSLGRINSSQFALLVKHGEQGKKKQKARTLQHSQQSKFARAIIRGSKAVAVCIFCVIRFLFLSLWIPLLLVELGILYLWTLLLYVYKAHPPTGIDSVVVEDDSFPFDWMLPIHLLNLHDVHIYPKPKQKQRSSQFWNKWYQSEKNPMRHTSSVDSSPGLKPLNRTRRKATFVPVVRTFSDVFGRRLRANSNTGAAGAARNRGARANGSGGLNIDIDPGILEQGRNSPHPAGAVALGNLGSIAESSERSPSPTT